MVDHEFGGLSTDLKLSVLEKYLKAYTTALRGQFDNLWYIDAFAGTGYRTVKHAAVPGGLVEEQPAWVEQRRGSAVIAIQTQPAFDRIIFIENKPSHCAALRELMEEYRGVRDITLHESDVNASIQQNVNWDGWGSTRAVMFLDPYGLSVDWATIEAVAKTRAIDVWYLVSLSGLFRQAAHDPEAMTDVKREAITRMLGTPEWEAAWYPEEVTTDMFGNVTVARKRGADVTAMETFVWERLRTIFPRVLAPLRLKNAGGVPTFALFFAISNPKPEAIGLATRIAGHILKAAGTGISS